MICSTTGYAKQEASVVLAGTIQHPAHSLVIVDLERGSSLRKISLGVARVERA